MNGYFFGSEITMCLNLLFDGGRKVILTGKMATIRIMLYSMRVQCLKKRNWWHLKVSYRQG